MASSLTSAQIRQTFLDFFVDKHAHTFVPSSPVVPHDDPTLLFANAGMNQFKPYFLGTAKAPWPRAANTQKCIRAGGKHNDLDDVGRSRRHHTFFEMLGNWSFGDYFKQGAIEMSWHLLTQVYRLDPKRLHVSCFIGSHGVPKDTQAADIWTKVANWEQYGLKSDDHIHYFGKDNFWEMGDTGPCGPCTEIYVDRRPQSEIDADRAAGIKAPVNGEDPRVMEIWNNVFIQYNRDATGKLTTLPSQHVDTGMGLERLCQVIQDKNDNYATDLFTPLFDALTKLTGITYHGKFPKTNAADPVAEAADQELRHDIAFRVIADHLRCLTFALTDGAVPTNDGRGYVLRRILRRAVRFGRQQLNLKDPFLHKLVPVVITTMGDMFPELKKNPQTVIELIKDEEISFGRTLDRGIALFEDAVLAYGAPELDAPVVISATTAFKLYDTFGFPIDLTQLMAAERGMTVDLPGYEKLMEEAKEKSRASEKGAGNPVFDLPPNILDELQKLNVQPTDDSPKFKRGPARATLRALWNGQKLEQSLDSTDTRPGQSIALILDKTNFYAEMGGQIGDSGELRTDSGANAHIGLSSSGADTLAGHGRSGHAVFVVETTRAVGGYVLHLGHLKSGKLTVTDALTASVLGGRSGRDSTEKNHTATHVANWALRETLGEHVQQKGSLVDPEKLRFDFLHQKPMTDDELAKVESLVSATIQKAYPVYAEIAPQSDALKIAGLRAVFGEKYPPMVRVVSIGAPVPNLLAQPSEIKWFQHSVEFCGGTHLANTSEIEAFAITSEESVSKGIRRLVAVTGPTAKESLAHAHVIQSLLAASRIAPDGSLAPHIAALQKAITDPLTPLRTKRHANSALAELQERQKKHQRASSEKSTGSGGGQSSFDPEQLLKSAETIGGTIVLVASVPEASADTLRNTWDWLKKKHPQQNIAALLASIVEDLDKDGNKLPPKVNLLAGVGDPLIAKLKAGDWVKAIAPLVGGSGGGRPQLAMAGGKDPAKLESALIAARDFAKTKLT